MNRSTQLLVAFATALSVAATASAGAQGKGHGHEKGKGHDKDKTASGQVRGKHDRDDDRDERDNDRNDDRNERDRRVRSSSGGTVAAGTHGTDRYRGPRGKIPPGHMPPAGMCRIWIDGVPPGHQPAPTDCATARANVPANGRVIYGGSTNTRCTDANADGRCDDTGAIYNRARTLPEMIGAILAGQGRPNAQVSSWLGTGNYTARTTDLDGDGKPDRATWLNSAGQIVQMWVDTNHDGRADRVTYYRNGKAYRSVIR